MSNDTFQVAHQFEDAEQQYESSLLGMWLFLVTEILFFGGLFLGYTLYRWMYPEAYAVASHHLNIVLGTINTVVLISSSLTMALAVHAAKIGKQKELVRFLLGTLGLGILFLGIKTFEYSHKFHEHLIPGKHFQFPNYQLPGTEIFFSFYFAMTGLHALHMIIGMIILGIFTWMAHRGKFGPAYSTPIDLMGLYWHFVDIIWIFLFPLLYLVARHA